MRNHDGWSALVAIPLLMLGACALHPEPIARTEPRFNLSSGSGFEERGSYSRAVIAGDWAFVSGTSGYDPELKGFAEDPQEQARQALKIIGTTLEKAGMSLADVVRVNMYLADRSYIGLMRPVLKEAFGATRPANTTVVVVPSIPEIKVEIEVTALRRHQVPR